MAFIPSLVSKKGFRGGFVLDISDRHPIVSRSAKRGVAVMAMDGSEVKATDIRVQQWDRMKEILHGDWLGRSKRCRLDDKGKLDEDNLLQNSESNYKVLFNEDGVTGSWVGTRDGEVFRSLDLSMETFGGFPKTIALKGICGQGALVKKTKDFIIEINFLSSDGCRRMVIVAFGPEKEGDTSATELEFKWVHFTPFRDQLPTDVDPVPFADPLEEMAVMREIMDVNPEVFVDGISTTGYMPADDLATIPLRSYLLGDWNESDRVIINLPDGMFFNVPKKLKLQNSSDSGGEDNEAASTLAFAAISAKDSSLQALRVYLDASLELHHVTTSSWGEHPVRTTRSPPK